MAFSGVTSVRFTAAPAEDKDNLKQNNLLHMMKITHTSDLSSALVLTMACGAG